MDFDRIADELYALAPGEFIAARDGRAGAARTEGDRELSAALKQLRKPTIGAWLANMLVRQHPDDVTRLIDLGSQLRAAQHELAGDRLRALSRRRREDVTALCRLGEGLARRAGVPVGDAAVDELQGTLEAAIADPSAAEALRSGRLTSALRFEGTGFGEIAATPPPRGRRPSRRRPDDRDRSSARRRHTEALRDAESAAAAAGRLVSAAKKKDAEAGRALAAVRSSFERATAEAGRLEKKMLDLERRAAEAGRHVRDAEGEQRAALRRLDELRAKGR